MTNGEGNVDDRSADVKGNLDALLQKVFEERGYDFREYKKASLQRRINKRLYENHLSTYEEYMGYLDERPEEYNRLFDTLLINVTEFFRDSEAWEVLGEEVISKILARKQKGEAIRIWSAGCASGEEAYSIAILLADKLGDSIGDYEIRIYGTDIDENALNEARKGTFSLNRMKNVSKEQIESYFIKEDDSYKIKRNIRQMIAFGRQDLIMDAPISHLDLIICRNVLIYFKIELQSRLVIKFHYALNRYGYIFFGKSESMLSGSKLFLPVNKKWRMFEKAAGAIPSMAPAERRATFLEESLIDQAVKEARKEFSAVEFYNQSVIQNLSLGIVVITTENTIVTWNSGAEGLWSIKTDYAVGRNFFDIGMGERIPGIRDEIGTALRDIRPVKVGEVESTGGAGEKTYLEISIVPLISPSKEKLGVIMIVSDVSEKRNMRQELEKSNDDLQALNEKLETTNAELEASNEELETTTEELQSTAEELETSNEELQSTNEELETSNEELRSINEELETTNDELKERTEQLNSIIAYNQSVIQGMRESLIAIDHNNVITIWNPTSVQMWGITSGNAVGRSIKNILPEVGLGAEEITAKILQVMGTCSAYHEDLFKYTASNGHTRSLEFDIVPILGSRSECNGAMLLFRDITEEVEVKQTLLKKSKIISAIYNITTLVSRPTSMNRTLQQGLDVAIKVTGANAGSIYLTKEQQPELMMTFSKNLPREFVESHSMVKVGEGFTGTIARSAEIYFINSLTSERRPMTDLSRVGIVSICGIPLLYRDEVIGVLELYSMDRDKFSADDMELYSGIGEQLAVAVRLARAPLNELGRIILCSTSLETIAAAILELVEKEFEARALWVYLYDEKQRKLKVVAQRGFPEGVIEKLVTAPGSGIVGETFKRKEGKLVEDIASKQDNLKAEEIKGFEGDVLVAMPLLIDDRAIGVLCMYVEDHENIEAGKEYLNLLMMFANQIALALNSALQIKFTS